MKTLKNWATGILVAFLLFMGADAYAAVTSYNYNNSNVLYSGLWTHGVTGTGGASGATLSTANGNNLSRVDFRFTGTDISFKNYVSVAGAFEWSIDGGAYTTSSVATSTLNDTSLATGLSDTTHAIVIRYKAATFQLNQANTFTVTGAAPALLKPTFINTVYSPGSSSTTAGGQIGVSSYYVGEGGWSTSFTGAFTYAVNSGGFNDGGVFFRATTDHISIYANKSSTLVRLVVDGVPMNPVSMNATDNYNWVVLGTGLDSTAEHEYRIVPVSGSLQVHHIGTLAGSMNTSAAPTTRTSIFFFGDSITNGVTGTNNDSAYAMAFRIGQAMDWQVFNRGVNGSTVLDTTGLPGTDGISAHTTSSGQARVTAQLGGASPVPNIVVFLYGTNDMANAAGLTTPETTTQFQTAYTDMLTKAVTAVPNSRILCLGILNRSGYSQGTIDTWNAAIKASITSVGNPNVSYVATDNWISSSAGVDTSDQLHPNGKGYRKIMTNILSWINGIYNARTIQ